MTTMIIHVTVEIDVEPIIESASIVLGKAALPKRGELEVKLFEKIRESIHMDVPHVVSVKTTNFQDC